MIRPLCIGRPIGHEPCVSSIVAFDGEPLPAFNPTEEVMVVDRELSDAGRVHTGAGRVGGGKRKEVGSQDLKHARGLCTEHTRMQADNLRVALAGSMTEYPRMNDEPFDRLRSRLRAALHDQRVDPTSVAKRIGRGPDYLRDFLNGRKKSISYKDFLRIKEVLGLPDEAFGDMLYDPMLTSSVDARLRNSDDLLKVYEAEEIEDGEFIIKIEVVSQFQKPWFVTNFRDAYAFIVPDESMSPAFESGDTAVVNPHLPPARGGPTLFLRSETSVGRVATLKILRARGAATWEVEQINPAKVHSLNRNEWPRAYPVTARIVR